MDSDVVSKLASSPSQIDVEKAVQMAIDDNDPQSMYYLNPSPAIVSSRADYDKMIEAIFTTQCLWATKIETTVQSQFGKGTPEARRTIQASWDRASYRPRLLDFTSRNTPWLALDRNLSSHVQIVLTGDYHTDKQACQDVVHAYLKEQLPEIKSDRLYIIEKAVAEMLVLTQEKVEKARRFGVLLPFLASRGTANRPALRIVTFTFEKNENSDHKVALDVAQTSYQATLNQRIFDQQQFDPNIIALGKTLVQNMTLDVVT